MDISQKNHAQILDDISDASKQGYPYIIILSQEDRVESFKLNLVDSYRQEAGYIYRFAAD